MDRTSDVFGIAGQTAAIQNPNGAIPDNLPSSFYTLTKDVDGDTVNVDIRQNSQETTAFGGYNSAPVTVAPVASSRKPFRLLYTANEMRHDPSILTRLRKMGTNDIDPKGINWIGEQIADAQRRLKTNRNHALLSALSLGNIHLDKNTNGNGYSLLPSSSGADITIDMGVPAANLGNLGGIINATWDAGTPGKPKKHIEAVQNAQAQAGNPPIKYAIYGNGVLDALGNDALTASLIRGASPDLAQGFRGTQAISLYGLTWIPAYTSFVTSAAGATKTNILDKKVIFCPEPTRDWYEMAQGSVAIAMNNNASTDVSAALDSIETMYGMWSMMRAEGVPASLCHYFGDVFLPTFKVPSNVYCATVLT